MNSKEFKNVFGDIAKAFGFSTAYGGWFKESSECFAVLELQKSNFGDSYLLNIKIFVQRAFEKTYSPVKNTIKSASGHVTKQIRDKDFLIFDKRMDDDIRKKAVEEFFNDYISPLIDKALSRQRLKDLEADGKIFLLPAVRDELKKLEYR